MMNKFTDEQIRMDIISQLNVADDHSDKLKLLVALLQEFIDRFISFVGDEDCEVKHVMSGALWRVIVVATETLDALALECIGPMHQTGALAAVQNFSQVISKLDSMKGSRVSASRIKASLQECVDGLVGLIKT